MEMFGIMVEMGKVLWDVLGGMLNECLDFSFVLSV